MASQQRVAFELSGGVTTLSGLVMLVLLGSKGGRISEPGWELGNSCLLDGVLSPFDDSQGKRYIDQVYLHVLGVVGVIWIEVV